MKVEFTVRTTIERPAEEVYEAVISPATLCRYFTSEASGRLEEGARVTWAWSPTERIEFRVGRIEPGRSVEFSWEAHRVGYDTNVRIGFEPTAGGTRVSVHETGWRPDQAGLESSYEHCAGWQHMLLSLRAFLLHGIDLRSPDAAPATTPPHAPL